MVMRNQRQRDWGDDKINFSTRGNFLWISSLDVFEDVEVKVI